jgi:hypothetical protein
MMDHRFLSGFPKNFIAQTLYRSEWRVKLAALHAANLLVPGSGGGS